MVFSVSLAVVDTTLTLFTIHGGGSAHLLGMLLTRYHVCVLVQILGQVYSALQWPVVVFTVTQRAQPAILRARWFFLLICDHLPVVPHCSLHLPVV